MEHPRNWNENKKARTIVSLLGPSFFDALFHAGSHDASVAWPKSKQTPRRKGEPKP